jgi:hypothetical protein
MNSVRDKTVSCKDHSLLLQGVRTRLSNISSGGRLMYSKFWRFESRTKVAAEQTGQQNGQAIWVRTGELSRVVGLPSAARGRGCPWFQVAKLEGAS